MSRPWCECSPWEAKIGFKLFYSDGKGTEYCHMVSSSYNFGKFDLGGFSKSVSPKLSVDTKKTAPKKNPDYTVEDKTTAEQALLYRLSGWVNCLLRLDSPADVALQRLQPATRKCLLIRLSLPKLKSNIRSIRRSARSSGSEAVFCTACVSTAS